MKENSANAMGIQLRTERNKLQTRKLKDDKMKIKVVEECEPQHDKSNDIYLVDENTKLNEIDEVELVIDQVLMNFKTRRHKIKLNKKDEKLSQLLRDFNMLT